MNYQEAIDWLYGTQLFGIKLGLENVSRLLMESEVPGGLQGKKIIHVAGTNGKGSVCAFAEKILRDAGFSTGLFTSPHLISFQERIRISGDQVSEAEIVEGLERIRSLVSDWDQHPTFFEITFVLAMRIFCDRDCERIILETGMGGRLDATNAIPADVSVITPVSLDHSEWLGETIRDIAGEKAGIIKADTPLIVGSLHPDARDVIGRRALTMNVPFIEAHPVPEEWQIGLAGQHQRENASMAVEAACRVDDPDEAKLTRDGIRDSLATTVWPGRFQFLKENLVLDGAHNPDAAATLAATWKQEFGDQKAKLIFGAALNKDVSGIFRHLAEIAEAVMFVPIQSERRMTGEEMEKFWIEAGGDATVAHTDDLLTAIETSAAIPGPTLIAGSLFLVGEALSLFEDGRTFEVSQQ